MWVMKDFAKNKVSKFVDMQRIYLFILSLKLTIYIVYNIILRLAFHSSCEAN